MLQLLLLFKEGRMLNFIIGRENIDLGPVHMDSPLYFRKAKPEWLNDGFARRAINAIDKAKVLNGFALENRYGYGMSSEQISTGTKTLLLIKNQLQFIYYASNMGGNCVPFLMELVKEREAAGMGDITLLLEHFMDIPYEYEGMLKIDGVPVTIDEYEDAVAEWCEHRDEPDYKWRDTD